ncbi:DUF2321 domain-containing protein [Christiangramia sp. SM2212]|uniref:DUF2321 domain-containing protein n=1 Tax=Christiangramia sediminicola TaxID=3073267 RepID=A0ABU1ERV5_9FLAO|nr:DUF2321 domain-containing protein [Christiangramia sp. SM2212]MDR5591132.1 DUF2321 domain-containing protein [Christiangramia sp. SM2212]
MAGKHDAYLVCENGHGINSSYYSSPEFNKKFCTTCGAKTRKDCPICGNDIEGEINFENVIDLSGGITPVPDICKHCGEAFPWKSEKEEILQNLDKVNKDDIFLLETILDKFHLVAKQIRQRYSDRETLDVKDEYDTQDLLHSLLRIYFEDIRNEEWNPSYAGSSTRSDFLLKKEEIVIEVKKTRSNLKAKQIGEQLIIDIAKYRTHPNCKILYCFVYDPEGYVSNPKGIENDLNDEISEMKVKVKIVPKGH